MSWELVAEGDNTNIWNIQSLEATEVAEGQRARLQCESLTPVPTWQIDDLRNSLTLTGVEDLQVRMSGNTIDITWRKGFPWAAVIVLALVAIIVIVVWRFFHEVQGIVGPVPTTLLVIGIAALLIGIAYQKVRQKY